MVFAGRGEVFFGPREAFFGAPTTKPPVTAVERFSDAAMGVSPGIASVAPTGHWGAIPAVDRTPGMWRVAGVVSVTNSADLRDFVERE